MIGGVKQQCVDEDGRYTWQRRQLKLDPSGRLELSDPATQYHSEIVLAGASAAKEWSFSSPVAGYGFDIIWPSGNISSFLVDDERSCQDWVESINKAIQNSQPQQQIPANTDKSTYNLNDPRAAGQSIYGTNPGTSLDWSFARPSDSKNFDLPSRMTDPSVLPMPIFPSTSTIPNFDKDPLVFNTARKELDNEPIRRPPIPPNTFYFREM